MDYMSSKGGRILRRKDEMFIISFDFIFRLT